MPQQHLSSAHLVIAHGFKRTRPAIPSRAKRCRVHRIPPRVRDDRDTPLLWGGMARVLEVIWVSRKPKYFCKEDWTTQIRLKNHDKSPRMRDGPSTESGLKCEIRHARACPGHPRLVSGAAKKDVDGRDKPGHDETTNPFQVVRERCAPHFRSGSQVPLRSCASAKNMSFHDAGRCFKRPTLCMNATCFIRLAGAVV